MATKVKPCRINATGTPQAGYVPKYVDEDTFQWGTGGGGSDIEYVTQAEYNALLPGAASDGKHYFIYTSSTPTPTIYTITGSTLLGSYTPGNFSDIQGCYLNPNGDKMYISFWNSFNGKMAQYSLSTPRNVSTASQVTSISVTKPNGFCFNGDGTYVFLSTENGNVIQRYSLSTAWDISTMSLDSGQTLAVPSSFAINVSLSEDGKYIYFGENAQTIHQYELTTAYDLTTATNHKTLSGQGRAIQIRNNGKYFYIGTTGFDVTQYELATAYDITSNKTEIGSFSGQGSCEQRAFFVSNDGKYRAYGTGNNGQNIVIYEAQPM